MKRKQPAAHQLTLIAVTVEGTPVPELVSLSYGYHSLSASVQAAAEVAAKWACDNRHTMASPEDAAALFRRSIAEHVEHALDQMRGDETYRALLHEFPSCNLFVELRTWFAQ